MDNPDLAELIAKDTGLVVAGTPGFQELKDQLVQHINFLINHNFEKLVSLLYRIDVSEAKIRSLLQHNEGEDSAGVIADLIIERQLQKIESRKKFSNHKDFNDEEKW